MSALTPPIGADDHVDGTPDAQITLVEYGDFQCPHCRKAAPTVQSLLQRSAGRLRFVWRHFPLTQIHEHALHAAEAAESAGAQGKFWEMHHHLFPRQSMLDDDYLVEYAQELGLDAERMARELAEDAWATRVRRDFRSGVKSGVNGTPTFFINGVRHDGAWDEETLLAALEAAASVSRPL
jgi:protein-disulfide isomerase